MRYSDLATSPYFRKTMDSSGRSFTTKWLVDTTVLTMDHVVVHNGNPVKSITWTHGMRCFFINYANHDGAVGFEKDADFTLAVAEVIYKPIYEVG